MASRSVDDLAPVVRARALAFVTECQRAGLDALIYCTLRTDEEQAGLFASGRTKPGPILTNAKPGESLHNPDGQGHAWAFDAVPLLGGKAIWTNQRAITLMGECGEFVGLDWAGRWRGTLRESVHFQLPRGVS